MVLGRRVDPTNRPPSECLTEADYQPIDQKGMSDARRAGQPASSPRDGVVHPGGDEGADRGFFAEAVGPAEAAPSGSDPESESDYSESACSSGTEVARETIAQRDDYDVITQFMDPTPGRGVDNCKHACWIVIPP
eukprot:8735537-Pyramimonas_sp.AAC.1